MARIKCEDRVPPEEYKQIRLDGSTFEEARDCSVIAIAVVCGITYQQAREVCAQHGRKPKEGMTAHAILQAVRYLGFNATRIDLEEFKSRLPEGHRRALKNLTTYHPRRFPGLFPKDKAYLAFSYAHVTAISGGEAKDWAAGRSKRITSIYEVTKAE